MMPAHSPKLPPGSKVAVVGAGISGLGAAWLLSQQHEVVLFEAANRLGGHAWTLDVSTRGRDISVDIGFIVFNRVNYPHLCALFERLDVPVIKSSMSFAVSLDHGKLEYGCLNVRSALAQPSNLMRAGFWRMFRDISVFNKRALSDSLADPNLTLGDLIERLGLGSWFKYHYLLPMSGAIWSTPRTDMLRFPAYALTRFFDNHGLLSFTGQHQWWTVKGGSKKYVSKLTADMRAQVRLCSPVREVRRDTDGVVVKTDATEVETFDAIVFACHSDTALQLLCDARETESRILGNIPYSKSRIVLHTDDRLMPRRKACWSSWVYLANSDQLEEKACVTYWMNSLQSIPSETPLFATLNPVMPINDRLVLAEHMVEHPQYDSAALIAQTELPTIQGQRNSWFCGAWTGMGFHEDGLASAVRVAVDIGVTPPWL